MRINTRFAVAIHVLALAKIARGESGGVAITSEQMAASVNTNPVVVRRVLGVLREAGLVTSQPGPGGGWRLTRGPHEISLGDVYRSIQDEPLFALPQREPDQSCSIGRGLPQVLVSCFREAEEALEERLDRTSIADVIDSISDVCLRVMETPLETASVSSLSHFHNT